MKKLLNMPVSQARVWIFQILENSMTWKDFAQAIGRSQLNKRERDILEQKYNVNIRSILKKNKLNRIQKRQQANLDRIVECTNCGRKYRNGDRLSNNKSGHYFCSDECAQKFSANSKTQSSFEKVSNSLKQYRQTHKHEIKCEKCGRSVQEDLWTKQYICGECLRNMTLADYQKYKFLRYKKHKIRQSCQICGAASGKCQHPEICRHRLAFPNYVKYLGFNPSTIGTEKVYDEFNRVKAYLYDLYNHQGMSIPDICAKLNYPYRTGNLIKLLRHFIQLRSTKDGYRQYMRNHKETPIHRTIGNAFFKNGEHKMWTGETIIYRSSYELDLCLELDQAKVQYKVEPFTVEYFDSKMKRNRFAIPDFYLPEHNVIIEVKSKFTFDKQNMLDKINAYMEQGYDFVLEYEHKSFCANDVQYIQAKDKIIKDFR